MYILSLVCSHIQRCMHIHRRACYVATCTSIQCTDVYTVSEQLVENCVGPVYGKVPHEITVGLGICPQEEVYTDGVYLGRGGGGREFMNLVFDELKRKKII